MVTKQPDTVHDDVASDSDDMDYGSESGINDDAVEANSVGADSASMDEDADEDADDELAQPGPLKPRKTSESSDGTKSSKKKKRGIIYISTIPKFMTVTILREMLGQYAKINRVFLQPGKQAGNDVRAEWGNNSIRCGNSINSILSVILSDDDAKKDKKKKKKNNHRMSRHFTEGWVEFESKRAAKQLALKLNNAPIATRKSSKFYDILWSIKYLPRFKWVHLSERLTYEKAVYRHKLQTEIAQARKEATFFEDNLDKSERNRKLQKKANKAKKVAV